MHATAYSYAVTTVLQISRKELKHLLDLSATHYDAKCRRLGTPGPGAVLHGWSGRFSEDENHDWSTGDPEEVVTVEATNDTLDTLCKLTEMPPADPALAWSLRLLLRDNTDEYARVNGVEQLRLGIRPSTKPTQAHDIVDFIRSAGWRHHAAGGFLWHKGQAHAMTADDALSYEYFEKRVVFSDIASILLPEK